MSFELECYVQLAFIENPNQNNFVCFYNQSSVCLDFFHSFQWKWPKTNLPNSICWVSMGNLIKRFLLIFEKRVIWDVLFDICSSPPPLLPLPSQNSNQIPINCKTNSIDLKKLLEFIGLTNLNFLSFFDSLNSESIITLHNCPSPPFIHPLSRTHKPQFSKAWQQQLDPRRWKANCTCAAAKPH